MIRKATTEDARFLANIYNEYVKRSVVTFETEPVTVQEMRRRIEEISVHFPFFVYEDGGKVSGYCYAHLWKTRAAYQQTLETTVYVDASSQKKGIGTELMKHLIAQCRQTGAHALIACITGDNHQSIKLHQRLGFRQVSHFHQVGIKFGRRLDVVDFQLLLC